MYFEFAISYFRVFFFCTFLNCLQPISSTFFTAIGQPVKGLFLSMTRQILFLLPLILTSLNRIDTISNAMELRGFGKNSKRTWYTQRPFARRDFIALGVGAALLLISLTVTIRFGRFYNPFL